MLEVSITNTKFWPWEEVESVIPPTQGFPYWTIRPVAKNEGKAMVRFHHEDSIKQLDLRGDEEEEVNERNGVRKNQMPSVLDGYRDITGGSEESDELPGL